MIKSPRWQLIQKDIRSLLIGLGITLLGAGLTYLSEYVAKADFGVYTPLMVTGWALIVNIIRKWITEGKYLK